GKYQQTIVSSTLANGRYDWAIPSTFKSGTDYTFKISSVSAGNTASDLSNSTFAITPKKDGFNIKFDYRFDQSNWFDAKKKAVIRAAGDVWESIILSEFENIAQGTSVFVSSMLTDNRRITLTEEIDDLLIFIGSKELEDGVLARAGATSPTSDRNTASSFQPSVGSMVFDPRRNWFLEIEENPSLNSSRQSDLLSTAVHEIGHILGIAAATNAFRGQTQNGFFHGPVSKALNDGSPIPLELNHKEHEDDEDRYSHIKDDFSIPGLGENSLDPTLTNGRRKLITQLDAAILDDIGYEIDYAPLKEVMVSSPNGGNNLEVGKSYNITWNDNFKENVKIELLKGGKYYRLLNASTSSDGSQLVNIPNNAAASGDYTLRISSVLDGR
ncbi:MAG: Ser-Thr-rich GPI-anchored membrane family protein, partial [Bacteroidota bacterium]